MFRLLLLLVLALPGQAWPHASLLNSEPADGASLDAAPSEVVLRFDEPIIPVALRLVGPDGHAVMLGPVKPQGGSLHASVPAGLPGGVYVLSWRVTSADSHPVAGTAVFGVGIPSPDTVARTPGPLSAWAAPSAAARFMFYAALLTAAGAALFRAAVAEVPAPLRRTLAAAALLGAALAAGQVGLRGALLADAGPGGLLEPAAWRLGVGTTLAASLAVSGIGLLACALTLLRDGQRWRMLGAAAAILALAGFPLSGHAATAEPRWLTAPAVALHTVAIAFWLGAFWPLLAILRGPAPHAVMAIRRFSRLAIPAVAVLVLSGLAIAAVQVMQPADLFATGYGQLLLAKLAGFATLIALAAWNRQRLTPALDAQRLGAARRLRRSIAAEVSVAGLILAATSALTLAVPPRALRHAGASHQHQLVQSIAPAQGIAITTKAQTLRAVIEVAPGQAGPNRITLTPDRAKAQMPNPKEVWVELSNANAGIGPIRRRMVPDGTGRHIHDGPELSIPGRWQINVQALVTDFDQASLSMEVEIR